jgi:predicted ATPase
VQLLNTHITNYRSVEDSGQFKIEPDVTCLVGKNESGKTATLRALYRLNPIETSAQFNEVIDFPARKTRDRKRWADHDRIPVIEATFRLNDSEAELVENEFGAGALTSREFTVTAGYRKAGRSWDIHYDEGVMVSHLRGQLDLNATSAATLESAKTIWQLVSALKQLEEPTAEASALLDRLNGLGGTGFGCVTGPLSPKLPKFVYFDDYDSMPGKVSIPDLIRRRDADGLTRGEQALLSLLTIAGTRPEEFQDAGEHERLIRELENSSAVISDEVFEYWSQNTELAVKLESLQAETGAAPPMNQAPILQIRVHNSRHRASVPFDDRSRGFVWFFSFLAYFNELEADADQDLILLLDEPGLSLHGRAQEDLLRLIDERLAPKHQVLYSTHSPFMVSADKFHRVRTVIDRDGVGTKVSAEVFEADEDTAFPLLTAMGIELSQTLFVGEHTLLLEGPSDLIYLDVLTDAVEARGKVGLDPRWVKTPIGGSGKLSTFVTLLGANKLNVAVLIDSSTQDVGAVKRLQDNKQLSKNGLVEISEFTGTVDADIEDLFERDFYLTLVNKAYEKELPSPLTPSDVNQKDPRIVRTIETYFKVNNIANGKFNHYRPAATLLRNQKTFLPKIRQVTRDRAEKLMAKLNGLLPEN